MSLEEAIVLQQQAWELQALGRLDDAMRACRRAVDLVEAADGPESADVANLLNDLAEIEQDRQEFGTARQLAERARIIEDKLGSQFAGSDAARIRARTLSLTGGLARASGDYTRAESDLRMALAISVAEFGTGSEEAADARNNLGVLFKYLGRFEEALHLYADALGPKVKAHGECSLAAAAIHHNVGGLLHARGEFAAALEPARTAWTIARDLLGEDDPRTIVEAGAYAAVLEGLGRYDESERLYRRALVVFEAAYGGEHVEVAATLHNLGSVLAATGRLSEAETCYRLALDKKTRLFGEQTPEVALTVNNLGSLLLQAGRAGEALPLLALACAVLERSLPATHPQLAAARENLRQAEARSAGFD
jgi:tetratricopeptide (TPR) repeat protein